MYIVKTINNFKSYNNKKILIKHYLRDEFSQTNLQFSLPLRSKICVNNINIFQTFSQYGTIKKLVLYENVYTLYVGIKLNLKYGFKLKDIVKIYHNNCVSYTYYDSELNKLKEGFTITFFFPKQNDYIIKSSKEGDYIFIKNDENSTYEFENNMFVYNFNNFLLNDNVIFNSLNYYKNNYSQQDYNYYTTLNSFENDRLLSQYNQDYYNINYNPNNVINNLNNIENNLKNIQNNLEKIEFHKPFSERIKFNNNNYPIIKNIENKTNLFENKTNLLENKTDLLENEAEHLENEAEHLENETEHLENKTDFLENEAEHLENEAEHLENEAEHLENEAEHLENKTDLLENEAEHLENKTDLLENQDEYLENKVEQLEKKEEFLEKKNDFENNSDYYEIESDSNIENNLEVNKEVQLVTKRIDLNKNCLDYIKEKEELEKFFIKDEVLNKYYLLKDTLNYLREYILYFVIIIIFIYNVIKN